MYLPRVNTNTQIKSESLKSREHTIKEKPMKVGRWRLVVSQLQREVGMELESKDSKWEKEKKLDVSSKD